ncbi:hypothetical protein AMAG_18081 [Allomyces macrogynus ATCC 38327]|uniref:Uncharacterized protein n=1 Tax=Allomyces macrogynus (strain ATCC 38327) TaxID=578462 RepID=A0A0L0S9D7_ALLM3|nr:hypothetical protein AMAG_18081 [Allomyces macrogynus ATCC 38327]|eukprot:KNE59004.1 hypothetical protein AMAG_18081 [Allomyces macrogynus ATCC 38327]
MVNDKLLFPNLRVLDVSQCAQLGDALAMGDPDVSGLFAKLPRLDELLINDYGDVLDDKRAATLLSGTNVRLLEIRKANASNDGVIAVIKGMPRLRVIDVSGCARVTIDEVEERVRALEGRAGRMWVDYSEDEYFSQESMERNSWMCIAKCIG